VNSDQGKPEIDYDQNATSRAHIGSPQEAEIVDHRSQEQSKRHVQVDEGNQPTALYRLGYGSLCAAKRLIVRKSALQG
jgi:hypothetical protein